MNSLQQRMLILACLLATTVTANAGVVVLADEDFEDGVTTGWSNGRISIGEASNPHFTTFLGRFFGPGGIFNSNSTSKTFDLPGDQTEVTIEFDFYEIDSWDVGELFQVFLDDNPVPVISDAFWEATYEDPPLATPLQPGPSPSHLGFNPSWPDQTYRYSFNYPTTSTSLKLNFLFGLDSGPFDESGGIDNVLITTTDTAAVPLPTAAWMGLSLLGSLGLTKAVKRKRLGVS